MTLATKQQSTDIDRIARRLEPEARRAFLNAIATLRQEIDRDELDRAIATGSVVAILTALRLERLQGALALLQEVVLEGVRRAGTAEARALERQLSIAIRFDLTDPRAIEFIRQHGAQLVREVSDETRRGISRTIERGFREGLSPPQMARMIRGRIGLTESQASIVANYETALRAAVRGELSFGALDARFTLNPVRGAGGLVEGRIQGAVVEYERRLLAMRADAIARTETMAAANAGQRELWQQLRDAGALDTMQQQEWVVSPDERVCPICDALAGERVRLGEPFSIGLDGPPAHPSCRCTADLVFE